MRWPMWSTENRIGRQDLISATGAILAFTRTISRSAGTFEIPGVHSAHPVYVTDETGSWQAQARDGALAWLRDAEGRVGE